MQFPFILCCDQGKCVLMILFLSLKHLPSDPSRRSMGKDSSRTEWAWAMMMMMNLERHWKSRVKNNIILVENSTSILY